VLESLRRLVATGACSSVLIMAGLMGAEVALARSHLVESSCIELVKAHKWVGLEAGGVPVSSGVRGPGFPLFHEEVAAVPS